jgi:hypothetical protein
MVLPVHFYSENPCAKPSTKGALNEENPYAEPEESTYGSASTSTEGFLL